MNTNPDADIEIKTQLSSQVRSMRNRRGWSQAKLATIMGTTQVTVSRIESSRGRSYPDIKTLARLAEVFEVDLEVRFEKRGRGAERRAEDGAEVAGDVSPSLGASPSPVPNPHALQSWLEQQVNSVIDAFERFVISKDQALSNWAILTADRAITWKELVTDMRKRTPIGVEYITRLLESRRFTRLNITANSVPILSDLGHRLVATGGDVQEYAKRYDMAGGLAGGLPGGTHALVEEKEGLCPCAFCKADCPVMLDGIEVVQGSEEVRCQWCKKPMENHMLFAYPNGSGHCRMGCDGRYYRL